MRDLWFDDFEESRDDSDVSLLLRNPANFNRATREDNGTMLRWERDVRHQRSVGLFTQAVGTRGDRFDRSAENWTKQERYS